MGCAARRKLGGIAGIQTVEIASDELSKRHAFEQRANVCQSATERFVEAERIYQGSSCLRKVRLDNRYRFAGGSGAAAKHGISSSYRVSEKLRALFDERV